MRIPRFLFDRLQHMVDTVPARRPPDVVIGDGNPPYLRRWWIIPRNPVFNIYLHQFGASDDDRALHSHPWLFNASIVLRGFYREHQPDGSKPLRVQGNAFWRWGSAWHRVELLPTVWGQPYPCWTLFITGPRVRQWGFACPQGFVHWKRFTDPATGGTTIGRGCD